MGGAQRPADRMDFDNKLAECSDRNLCGRCTPVYTVQLMWMGGGGGVRLSVQPCAGILGQAMKGKIDSWGPQKLKIQALIVYSRAADPGLH
jgi:hypothetical protein